MAVDKPRDLSSEQSFRNSEGASSDTRYGKRAGSSLDCPQDREALHRHTEASKSRRHEEPPRARDEKKLPIVGKSRHWPPHLHAASRQTSRTEKSAYAPIFADPRQCRKPDTIKAHYERRDDAESRNRPLIPQPVR